MSPLFLTVFCGLLLTVSAFSNDVMLPALFAIHADLGGTMEQVQLAFPVFILVAAAGQLLFGASSDRFGRRPTILIGLACYIVGSLIATLSGSIAMLLAGRAMQGLGSACCQVVARAVLRDTYHGVDLARAMALAMAIFGFGPIIAPILGFGLLELGNWRAVFGAMLALGAILLIVGTIGLRETNQKPDPDALRPDRFVSGTARILAHPQSRFFLICACLLYFCMVSYVANAPRLFKSSFDIDGLTFAVLFASTGFGILISQLANNRLLLRFGVLPTTQAAAALLALVALATVVLTVSDLLEWISFSILMLVFGALFLIVFSNAASLVIDPHKEMAGLAASIFGAVTQLFGALMLFAALPLFKGQMLPWSIGVALSTVAVLVGLFVYRSPSASAE